MRKQSHSRGRKAAPPGELGRAPSKVEHVQEQIFQLAKENELRPGERLSTQDELAQQFGVSKGLVREAVLRLVGAGLLEAKRGGRITIANPRPSRVLRYQFLPLTHDLEALRRLLDLRIMIEIGNAYVVVERLNNEQIAELRDLVEHMRTAKSAEQVNAIDCDFHVRLLKLSGDPLAEDLGKVVVRSFEAIHTHGGWIPVPREWEYEEHKTLVEALGRRDPAQFAGVLYHHLRRNAKLLRSAKPQDGQAAIKGSA